MELIFRGEHSLFTRTDQIKLKTGKNKPVDGVNIIRAIERALEWKVREKDKNDIRTTLNYVLAIDSLWKTHLRPKKIADSYVGKTTMTKDEVLRQVRAYQFSDVIILNAIASIYNVKITIIDGA